MVRAKTEEEAAKEMSALCEQLRPMLLERLEQGMNTGDIVSALANVMSEVASVGGISPGDLLYAMSSIIIWKAGGVHGTAIDARTGETKKGNSIDQE